MQEIEQETGEAAEPHNAEEAEKPEITERLSVQENKADVLQRAVAVAENVQSNFDADTARTVENLRLEDAESATVTTENLRLESASRKIQNPVSISSATDPRFRIVGIRPSEEAPVQKKAPWYQEKPLLPILAKNFCSALTPWDGIFFP